MKSAQDLRKLLNEIHRKSYPAYKGTKGSYRFADYILQIDHVQGDPFASPSKVSVAIDGQLARFPKQLLTRNIADRAAGLSDKSILSEDRTLQLQGKGVGEKWFVVCQQMRTGDSGADSLHD